MRLHIEKLITGGSGLARENGKTYFVEGVLEGEDVSAETTFEKKKFAEAKAVKIITPSAHRVAPACREHFTCEKASGNQLYCGGCSWQHIDYPAQLEFKKNILSENLRRLGGINYGKPINITESAKTFRYRNKALFPITKKENEITAGFYLPGTHQIVNLDDCLVQPEIAAQILGFIKKKLGEHSISLYDEKKHSGALRHIFIRTTNTSEAVVGFISRNYESAYETLARELMNEFVQVKGVVYNENPDKTNIILGKRWGKITGEHFVTENLPETGLKIRISYGGFFQVNSFMADKLYLKTAEQFDKSDCRVIYDLFSGVGGFGLAASKYAKEIVCVEEVEQAVIDGVTNANFNGAQNIKCFAAKTEEYLSKVKSMKNDGVIVDPPRSGLSKEIIGLLLKLKPKKLAYVSCDSATFCRDSKLLIQNGYKLTNIEAFDMFPQTPHLEVLGVFQI